MSPWSSIAVSDQTGSVMRPLWPLALAVLCEKATVPKFVSGSVVQLPAESQPLGASVTHSAEPRSGRAMWSFFVMSLPEVTSLIRMTTVFLLTETVAENVSPGRTDIFSITGGVGSSSYQAEYVGVPPA